MASATIISLAFLKVNWDELRIGYLDNFVPMIAECLRASPEEVVSLQDLQERFQREFGLRLPRNVINTLLKRAKKHGFVLVRSGVLYKDASKLSKLEFRERRQEVVRMHETLISNLIKFCKEEFNTNWSEEEAETALLSFLEENQFGIIGSAGPNKIIPSLEHPVKSAKYLVGAFVQHVQEVFSPDLDYLETIAKGYMLANAIFLPDPSQASRKFHRTKVYFDTTFLIYSLGFAGETRKAPCEELLNLLYETGAVLCCFRHTLSEIRGSLEACAFRMSQAGIRSAQGPILPSVEYFLSKGYAPSDIELMSVQLEERLATLRIQVTDKPEYVYKYTIDEKALAVALEKEIQYHNPQARDRDVDSISAIFRISKGQEYFFVEDCPALFVTTNTSLAKIATQFFYSEATTPNAVTQFLTDYDLTTLLWLKKPLQAPDLPKKRIIADCFAATQPSDRLWRLYLGEIDRLEKASAITEEQYYLLRLSLEAKSALMELTLGEEQAFTQGTIPEILDYVRNRMRADLVSQLADAEKAVKKAESKEIERNQRLKARSQQFAHSACQVLKFGGLSLLFLGVVSTFPWNLPPFDKSLLRYIMTFLQILLLLLSVANLAYGTTLEGLIRKIEIHLSESIESQVLKIFGLD